MLAGIGGGFNFDLSWNPFGKYLPWILCMIVVLGLLALAMYMKMMGVA
jgi:Na+/melibiose symporter-like transporter